MVVETLDLREMSRRAALKIAASRLKYAVEGEAFNLIGDTDDFEQVFVYFFRRLGKEVNSHRSGSKRVVKLVW